jgi:4-hydroxy-2-oxoglutarate aldolase
MKNSSGRETADYAVAVGANERFCFHAGRVSTLCGDFKQGAVGATLSTADFWPGACVNAYRLLKQGRDEEAAELCTKIDKAAKIGASAYGVAGVKYAMDIAGFCGGDPRLPLLPLDEQQKQQVRISFELIGEDVI